MATSIALNKNGLTARMILNATPQETKGRAANVRVTGLKGIKSTVGLGKYVSSTRSIRNDDGSPRTEAPTYATTIILMNRHGHLIIDCTCKYHPYWGAEYALALRNAAVMRRSNGEAPVVRNPTLQVYACKHATAMLLRLQSLGKLRS